jgi:hypothetical protein
VSPSQAFQNTLALQIAFMAAVVVYVGVGEVLRWSDPLFADGGYGPEWIHDNETWVRFGLLAFAVVNALPVFLLYNREWYLDRLLEKSKKEPVTSLCEALRAVQILKQVDMGCVAVFGLLLYIFTGERVNLYLFCGLSLVGLLLVWPRRAEWERMFRRYAAKYPDVPVSPWLTS